MAGYEFTGKIKRIMDQQNFPSGFTKREFVVTSEDRYPQDIKFECVKEKCALLDSVSEGDRITVSFDLRGNEYNDRFFVNLAAWKIAPVDESAAAPQAEEDMPFEDIETDPDIGIDF